MWGGDKVKQGGSGEHCQKCRFWKMGEEKPEMRPVAELWSEFGHITRAIPIGQSSGDVRWTGVRLEVQEARKS